MRWVWGLVVSGIVALACSLASPALAQAKSLYYRELAVTATLDADGRLHVEERQAMVFDGDWNGGERRLRLSGDQELRVESVTRVDANGQPVALERGDLAVNDHYDFQDWQTLRWRARPPDAPPFRQTEIVYVISYMLSNILVDEGDTYLLDHDFAFPDRPGNIESFRLSLELDSVWKAKTELNQHFVGGPLEPGSGFVVTASLDHTGPGEPAGVIALASPVQRRAIVATLLGVVGLLFAWLFRREARLGRFAPLLAPSRIDRRWLAEYVFVLPPELVGALHDRRVGQPEVIAVIARMVGEQKLASRVTEASAASPAELELWLLVERASLPGYERSLVDQLFVVGNSTSTSALRAHYRRSGFDPAKCLRDELQPQADALLGIRPRSLARIIGAVLLLAGSSLLMLLIAAEAPGGAPGALVIALIGTVATVIPSGMCAHFWVSNVERPALAAWTFVGPMGFAALSLSAIILWWPALPPIVAVSLAFSGIAATGIVVLLAPSRDQPSGMALRKRLVSARRFFAEELDGPQPRIDDAWFPYLVAFGLVDKMHHWFRSFGAPTRRSSLQDDWHSSSGSASTSSPNGAGAERGWTGGGGAFGGAGASGSWVAATGVLASGIASPGSSSSSRSSGSSSSSSGGGGGGGW